MAPSLTDTIIQHLWETTDGQPSGNVFALLDAARDERIYPKIFAAENEKACLFRGEQAEELAWVGPYLVALERGDAFTRWILEYGWGKSWGIFARSGADFSELKRHFRALLQVYDEDGKSLFFRYYDPRVLRVFLPTCNAGEIRVVFGPVEFFGLEGKFSYLLLKTTADWKKGLKTIEISV